MPKTKVRSDRRRIHTTFAVITPILVLFVFITSVNFRHTQEYFAASAQSDGNSTGNVTNSYVNRNIANTTTSTKAGSEHIYRGGAAAGVGGE